MEKMQWEESGDKAAVEISVRKSIITGVSQVAAILASKSKR